METERKEGKGEEKKKKILSEEDKEMVKDEDFL